MADRPRNDAAVLEELQASDPEFFAELDRMIPAERPGPDFKVTFDRPFTPALESEPRDTSLLPTRAATDSGVRVELDDALATCGVDRSELEAELDSDIAAGLENGPLGIGQVSRVRHAFQDCGTTPLWHKESPDRIGHTLVARDASHWP